MLGNYRVAAQLVASRVVLSSTELISQFNNESLCTIHVLSCISVPFTKPYSVHIRLELSSKLVNNLI
jgi:hypothetical protein